MTSGAKAQPKCSQMLVARLLGLYAPPLTVRVLTTRIHACRRPHLLCAARWRGESVPALGHGKRRGRPRRTRLFRGMRVKGTVHGGLVAVRAHAGPAQCPQEPRPYTGGFERGAHETLRVEAPNPEWVRDGSWATLGTRSKRMPNVAAASGRPAANRSLYLWKSTSD